ESHRDRRPSPLRRAPHRSSMALTQLDRRSFPAHNSFAVCGVGREFLSKPQPHTVRNATVGGSRDARRAGIRPANAPIRMAEAMPPDHASVGMTTAQLLELA